MVALLRHLSRPVPQIPTTSRQELIAGSPKPQTTHHRKFLTEEEIHSLFQDRRDGMTLVQLSDKYEASLTTIKSGLRRYHITKHRS